MTEAFVVGVQLRDDPIGVAADGSGSADLAELIRAAESAGVDYIGLDDALLGPGDGVPRATAGETLAYLARRTSRIALVPGVAAHYVEPFHAAKQVATLDFVSEGRAGVLVQAERIAAADLLVPAASDLDEPGLRAQAAEFTHVLRQLWDSWEDDATVRDVATGQYVDSSRVHSIAHEGRYFRVRGPLITPRPPQGQPPVFARAESKAAARELWSGPSETTAPDVILVDELDTEAILAEYPTGAATRLIVVLAGEDAPGLAARIDAWRATPGIAGVEIRTDTAGLRALLAGGLKPVWAGDVERTTLAGRLGLPRRPSRFASAQ
ncbi:LLM class flavin-dependent oxidoreductase [Mycetocola lacteus]|uniref:LLM class flavin-dependent oxidoreductase n=1 Tax=Mycetocola lacteus TaxID=76637 RepID=A0A3L7AQ06_9MICO|nr:LLM class flavin-dependent oxidoreductase [Mycetocola lacteus]RLP82204.1 LLM class flavin-dependent oxidoreductase [Mycetocola lacteus]